MTATAETVEFELVPRAYRAGDNFASRQWVVASCPRCQADHVVRADSAADAEEGFGASSAVFPVHTPDECMKYLAETVRELRSDLSSIKDTLENVRNSF